MRTVNARPRRFRLGRLARRLGHVAGARRDQGRQRVPLARRRLPEELRHAAVAEQLAAREFGAQQLPELRDRHRRRGIHVGGGIQDDVRALDIAREGQEFGQQDAGAEIGGGALQRGARRGNRIAEAAGMEQGTSIAGPARGIAHDQPLAPLRPGAEISVIRMKVADTS